MPTLGITSTYLRGIDNTEIIRAVHELGSTHDSRRPNPPRLSRAPLSHAVMAAPVTDSPRLRHRRPCHRTVPAGTSRILRPSRIAKCLQPGTRAVLTPPQQAVALLSRGAGVGMAKAVVRTTAAERAIARGDGHVVGASSVSFAQPHFVD